MVSIVRICTQGVRDTHRPPWKTPNELYFKDIDGASRTYLPPDVEAPVVWLPCHLRSISYMGLGADQASNTAF